MSCGLHPLDCAADHAAPALGLRCTSQHQWSGPCPACHGGHCLSLNVKSGRMLWHCNRKPPCSQIVLTTALAAILPACIGTGRPRQRHDVVARSELEQLIGLSGAALQLRIACLAWDCTPQAAAAKLGMPERTYRRAVTTRPNLARNRK